MTHLNSHLHKDMSLGITSFCNYTNYLLVTQTCRKHTCSYKQTYDFTRRYHKLCKSDFLQVINLGIFSWCSHFLHTASAENRTRN